MEAYRTEEEQVEALRKWWDDNGRSTIFAVVVAIGLAFGWQSWLGYSDGQRELASELYQAMIEAGGSGELNAEQRAAAVSLANQLKENFPGSTYAQFAALQLARGAVEAGQLDQAEAELRWVLGKAAKGGDIAQVTELRLARVLAARGDPDGALAVLEAADEGPYAAAYTVARGDVLLALGREGEARQAYANAQVMGASGAGLPGGGTLAQKLESLAPVPARSLEGSDPAGTAVDPLEQAEQRPESLDADRESATMDAPDPASGEE